MAPRELVASGHLWFEEQPADELALVLSGTLLVSVGVQEVSEVAAGELVGEAGTFFGDPRVAGVRARGAARLAVLSRERLLHLRGAEPAVYDLLLARALDQLARRVQAAGRKVALLGNGGVEPPVRKPPSMLTRLLRSAAAGSERPAIPVLPVLRRLPVLGSASPAALSRIGAAAKPRRLELDEVLVLEGEPGDSLFVLGEGEVEVLRSVRGGRARRLATMSEVAVFGTGALLLGERRNASIKVTRAGWAWELDRAAHDALDGEAGRAWRESLLVALRHQVNEASRGLAELQGGTSAAERKRLRQLAANLSGVPAGEVADDPWTFAGRARD